MRRFLTICLAASILAAPADLRAQSQSQPQSQPESPLTALEREDLRAEIRAYLLEHPEVIMEAIQILEERRNQRARDADQALISRYSEVLRHDPQSYVGGNPDGDVTLVEFSDYSCPYCKRAHPIVKRALELDPNLRYVLKEFPILGPASVAAGRMAMAALMIDRSRYAELNDRLMSYEGRLSETAAYRIAKEVGYDIAELKAKAASPEVDAQLNETYELARNLGLRGTPSFVIGSEVIRGFVPLEELRASIESARQASN